MISFHFPPIAARAAVNGHPPTGLARRGRESGRGSLPAGTFLTDCISQTTFPVVLLRKVFLLFCGDQASRAREGPWRWGGSPTVMEGSDVRDTRYTVECDLSSGYCTANRRRAVNADTEV